MSTLKVNRIEPRTGDTVDIVGFGTGGRIVNSGTLFEDTQITLTPNTTANNVIQWTVPKTAPENNVAVFIDVTGVQTRTRSTAASSGTVSIKSYISDDGGTTSLTGDKYTGCSPPSSLGNPKDNWVAGNFVFTFTDTTNSPELNLSLTTISFGNSAEDRLFINFNNTMTTLTWLEFEGV